MTQRSLQAAQPAIMPRLSAPLTKLRKLWLNSVKDLEPQAALAVLRQRLKSETDEAKRLGNIAAQSWIVRQRLIGLQSALHGLPVANVGEVAEPQAVAATLTEDFATVEAAPAESDDIPTAPQNEDWKKLRILEETEVNGMRFFAGTTIQVLADDARKLIEAKSAELAELIEEPAQKPKARPAKKAAPKK
ncbi:MAG: hypothetical protein O3C59_01705 [Proteobacteria bacterium]|nr:hypothetical protein [Pseudomonadota bacterium]